MNGKHTVRVAARPCKRCAKPGGQQGQPAAGDNPSPRQALSTQPTRSQPGLSGGAERAARPPSPQHREVRRRSPQRAGPPWVRRDKCPPERRSAAGRGRAARPLLTAPSRLLARLKRWRGRPGAARSPFGTRRWSVGSSPAFVEPSSKAIPQTPHR